MGFKHAAILTPVSFFLGVLFICLNVDRLLLWGELTDQAVENGFNFYTAFYYSPPAIKALLHGMIGVGMVGLLLKLLKWDDSAFLFDGTSTGAYIFAMSIYTSVTIPTLRAVVEPLEDETRDERVEAMRILSAANVIIAFLFGGILILQAGQEYARRQEHAALQKIQLAENKKDT